VTLVLTCLTQDDIVQVSDTRLTWPDGTLFDDHTIKTTLLCGRHLVSYTGLACLSGERTEFAIAFAAAHGDLIDDSITSIRTAMTKAVLRSTASHNGIEIVSAGWARMGVGAPLAPLVVSLSNLTNGSWDLPARGDFDEQGGFILRFGRVPFRLVVTGQELMPAEGVILHRQLRRAVAGGVGPRTIAFLMAAMMRVVASRNRRVGPNMMVASLPRAATPADDIVTYPEPDWTKPAFLYITNEKLAGAYLPNTACGGIATNVRSSPAAGSHRASARTLPIGLAATQRRVMRLKACGRIPRLVPGPFAEPILEPSLIPPARQKGFRTMSAMISARSATSR
jgi:hypothetical protein